MFGCALIIDAAAVSSMVGFPNKGRAVANAIVVPAKRICAEEPSNTLKATVNKMEKATGRGIVWDAN